MQIIVVTLGHAGESPTQEGMLILNYAPEAGGRTNIGVDIRRPRGMGIDPASGELAPVVGPFPTWEKVAAGLAVNLSRPEWPTFIRGKAQGNTLRLSCPDELNDVVFFAEFQSDEGRLLHPDFVSIRQEIF